MWRKLEFSTNGGPRTVYWRINVLFLLCSFACLCSTSFGLVVVDQVHRQESFGATLGTSLDGTRELAQTFTVGVGGRLRRIDIPLYASGQASAVGIRFRLYSTYPLVDVPGGLPRKEPLFETTIDTSTLSDFTASYPVGASIDLRGKEINVDPGDELAWSVKAPDIPNSPFRLSAGGISTYPLGGTAGRDSDFAQWDVAPTTSSRDYFYRTYVDTDIVSVTSSFSPAVTAQSTRVDGVVPIFYTSPGELRIQQHLRDGVDSRAVLEFPIMDLPLDGVIAEASLALDVMSVDPADADWSNIMVFAYEGNGTASVEDALVTPHLVGVSDKVASAGPLSIDLDTDQLRDLVSEKSFLGLTLVASPEGSTITINNATSEPMVLLSFNEQGPGDYNADGIVDLADYTLWRDSLGATGAGLAADGNGDLVVDALDYGVWKSHMGQTAAQTGQASATVPEPAGEMVMLLTTTMFATAVRRRVR